MSKPFVYYILHNSHTDVGYTDYQEKIEAYHVSYIKEAIDILRAAKKDKPEWRGFKWNCESYWCVELFLKSADSAYREDFIKYVKNGDIGLSGSYLNLSDIIDRDTLYEIMDRNRAQTASFGVQMRSALTCDINGYPWGYADALIDHGITRILSAIHAHHGRHPLDRRQTAFWWRSPKGGKVLSWIGEHYHLGNELGLARQSSFEYVIRDGLDAKEPDLFKRAEMRLENYKNKLKSEGYAFDFVPVNVSGMMTDNGSPNASIAEFCQLYNAKHGDEIFLKMATLDEFFDAVEACGADLPTYEGDWTDWWADGTGSTPDSLQHYRDAQRKMRILRSLDPECKYCSKQLVDSARDDIMFYSEHTWGFCSSVSEPWNPYVNGLDKRKTLYASRANEAISRALDEYTFAMGETPVSFQKDFTVKVINPNENRFAGTAEVPLKGFFGHRYFDLVRAGTNDITPYQVSYYARGPVLLFDVDLAPGEIAEYMLRDLDAPRKNEADEVDYTALETDFFTVRFEEGKGLVSLYDKRKNVELIRADAKYPPFTPIYEVTPMTGRGPCGTRGAMGLNRKCADTQRSAGKLLSIEVVENGVIRTKVMLSYELEGSEFCRVVYSISKRQPRIDIDLVLHKKSVWEPENLYLALPFTAGDGEEFWVEKTGAVLRPRIDQLPNCCSDYFALQSGMAFCSGAGSVIVATPDLPLITLGQLEVHKPSLCGAKDLKNVDEVYAWVMNNFWETNFKVSLGGFGQYRYTLLSSEETKPEKAIESAREASTGLLGFASFTKDK